MSGRGRVVALSNGLIATALVAVLAAVALVVRPPAPPGIAEFAPQATKPITKAPPGQAALHGSGAGTCAAGQSCLAARPTPSAVPTAVPTLSPGTGAPPGLQCYQWPDGTVTQTEDPQSPPCIATWDAPKGNGGATSRGVTGTTITVLVPWLHSFYTKGEPQFDARIVDLQTYFNRRFQLYGRTLRFVAPVGTSECGSPSEVRAAAAGAAQQKVFASTEMPGCEGEAAYPTALAERHIIAISHTSAEMTRRSQVRSAPYLWSYAPAWDALQEQSGEFACKNLRGAADYAGAVTKLQTRSFVFLRRSDDPDLSLLRSRLAACLGTAPSMKEYDGSRCGDTQQMVDLNQAGVTTLVTPSGGLQCLQKAADSVGYQPEWFVVPARYDFFEEVNHTATAASPASQMGHTFGLMPLDKLLTSQQEPAFRAIVSINASHAPTLIVTPRAMYEQLLLLVSGIQMAGPQLTPATFAAGLEATDFPNPSSGRAPSFQAHVGFATDDHAMLDDASIWWWNSAVRSVDGNPGGGFCYVNRGERWAPGSWPSNLRLQQSQSCR